MAKPELVSDPIEVRLEPHRGWDDNATIPGWVEHDIYNVFAYSEGLAHRNAEKRLLVGTIGKQKGAGFCPSNEFNAFTYPHQRWIDEEARRLHGEASGTPCANLPPHEELEDLIAEANGETVKEDSE